MENRFVVGHVGRFEEQKNHEFLVDIFNEIAKEREDAVLLLIGDGELKEQITAKVQEYAIENQVQFWESERTFRSYGMRWMYLCFRRCLKVCR